MLHRFRLCSKGCCGSSFVPLRWISCWSRSTDSCLLEVQKGSTVLLSLDLASLGLRWSVWGADMDPPAAALRVLERSRQLFEAGTRERFWDILSSQSKISSKTQRHPKTPYSTQPQPFAWHLWRLAIRRISFPSGEPASGLSGWQDPQRHLSLEQEWIFHVSLSAIKVAATSPSSLLSGFRWGNPKHSLSTNSHPCVMLIWLSAFAFIKHWEQGRH